MIRQPVRLAATLFALLAWHISLPEASAQKKVPAPPKATPQVFAPRAPAVAKEPAPESRHAILFSLDGSYLQLKDKLATPLRHQGFVSGVRLGYERLSTSATMQTVNLGLRMGDVESRLGTTADITGIALDAGWVWEVYKAEDPQFRAYAGASVNLLTQVHFFPTLDESHGYWLTSYEARPVAVATYRLADKSTLRSELSFPVVALVSRPPAERFYNNDKPDAGYIVGKVNGDMQITSLHDYRSIQWKTGYRYRMNEFFAEHIQYEFRYLGFDQPQEVQLLSHALLLTLEYLP